MLNFNSPGLRMWLHLGALLTTVALVFSTARGQTNSSTGSVQGTVTDGNGAIISGANVTLTNKATNQASTSTTNDAGVYTFDALTPGEYVVRVEHPGFAAGEIPVTVQADTTASGSLKLVPEKKPAFIQEEERPTIGALIGAERNENLPLNGRNFLDLGQIEPGVQVQDGGSFDATKNQFSSVSIAGRYGRNVRIALDGVDINDETVGTTAENIPASAIQEFQISQSLVDVSTELAASGAVGVTTRSGTNSYHGEAFGSYRNINAAGAALPGGEKSPFERQQFGGNFGGALIKDKLFFFVDGERNRQDLTNPVLLGGAFAGLAAPVGEPFRELETTDRLDYIFSNHARALLRFSYDQNKGVRPSGVGQSFQPFLNRTNTPSFEGGLELSRGPYTHSLRFGYLKFRDQIADASNELSGIYNPIPNEAINIGGGPLAGYGCAFGSIYCSGPNPLAPQRNYQTDEQVNYDGSRVAGAHRLRLGVSFNRILVGSFAPYYGLGPTLGDNVTTNSINTFSGGAANPLNYIVTDAVVGNGQGFSTETGQFGFPGGGRTDNRIGAYFGDSWKMSPTLSLTYGVSWIRDTGRTDSDLAPVPCSASGLLSCSGRLLDQWGPGLGASVYQPNKNFAPQAGFAWDPSTTGKTIFRGGIGLYYDNALFNNVRFDRAPRLANGLFLSHALACSGGQAETVAWPTNPGPAGSSIAGGAGLSTGTGGVRPTWCNQAMGTAAGAAYQFEQALEAATRTAGPGTNASFIGNLLSEGAINGDTVISPNYRTPRSIQMNIGLQREIKPGTILTADILANVSTHTLLSIDENHGGDVSTFNSANAAADRDTVQIANGCPIGPGQAACVVNKLGSAGAALAAYGSAGIGGPVQVDSGLPSSRSGINYAFPGRNPDVGELLMGIPEGRSVYKALQISLQQQTQHMGIRGIRGGNFQVSYTWSRYRSQSADSGFIPMATDFNNADRFTGPNALDRNHQISGGGTFDLPAHFRLGVMGHFFSPLAQTLSLPAAVGGGAEILVSDWTGDGTPGDPLPGTNIGSYMRTIHTDGLAKAISHYNTTFAGQPTPAGNALIGANVFTLGDLQAIGGVQQPLASTIVDPAGLAWLKTVDLNLGWTYKIKERVTIEPRASVFNVFNFGNFDLPGDLQSGVLSLSSGSVLASYYGGSSTQPQGVVGGTSANILDRLTYRTNRASLLSGMNGLGAPRAMEWGLRITF
jgi:Carboxypeptidase regulatory-like domain